MNASVDDRCQGRNARRQLLGARGLALAAKVRAARELNEERAGDRTPALPSRGRHGRDSSDSRSICRRRGACETPQQGPFFRLSECTPLSEPGAFTSGSSAEVALSGLSVSNGIGKPGRSDRGCLNPKDDDFHV